MGKMAQIRQLLNFKNSKLSNFYNNLKKVAKNIEGFCFFFLSSYLLCSQIWLFFFFGMIVTLAISQNPSKKPCMVENQKSFFDI
jgi:hypothetical protein